nr:ATP-binding protein [Pyrinomonadaceae bacterium]
KQLLVSMTVSVLFAGFSFIWWNYGTTLSFYFDSLTDIPQVFSTEIQAIVLVLTGVIAAFIGEKFSLKSILPIAVIVSLTWVLASLVSIKLWSVGLFSLPISIVFFSTVVLIHLKKLWQIDRQLTKKLIEISSFRNLQESKSAELRVESGLKLLETILPFSHAVVFNLDEKGGLVPVGRSKNRKNNEIALNQSGAIYNNEWREGVSLCERAIKSRKMEMQIDTEDADSAGIALPLISNDVLVGALFVNINRNFQRADINLLDAFSDQIARNFQRQELKNKPLSNESFWSFFSTQSSENRIEALNAHQGFLSEQSFGNFAIAQLKEAHAIAYLDGTIAYLNGKMKHLGNINSNEVQDLDIFKLLERFRTDIFSHPSLVLRKLMQTGDTFCAELNFTEPYRVLDMQISLVKVPNDEKLMHDTDVAAKPACFLVTFRDITAQKENEKLRSDMASLMSHELRTPITSIKGFAELLLLDDKIPAEAKEFLGIISNESQRLSKMLSTFLSVSNLKQSDKQEFQKTTVKLDNVVHEVVNDMQETAKKKRIYLVERANPNIPPVAADKGLIRKALSHLIDNAIKYSPDKSSVIITTLLEAEALRVVVEDRGYGIPVAEQEKVWEKFYRVARDGQDKEEESTGLGLSLVKEIVEQHGGQVGIKSQVGQGSKFSFTLPRL